MELARILDAAELAVRAHAGAARKGHPDVPYASHVIDVARRVAAAGADETLVLGALLHDVVEDTEVTLGEIEARFGDEVAALVAEVTDPPDLGEEARRTRQVRLAPEASQRAQMLKIADKTSNLVDLVEAPPDWPEDRSRAYLAWARRLVDGLRGRYPELEAAFDKTAGALEQRLEGE